jgi:hypothetical protein
MPVKFCMARIGRRVRQFGDFVRISCWQAIDLASKPNAAQPLGWGQALVRLDFGLGDRIAAFPTRDRSLRLIDLAPLLAELVRHVRHALLSGIPQFVSQLH